MNGGYGGHQVQRRNFWNDIGKIFSFPFSKQGAATLVVGGVVFGIARFVASHAGCFGWGISAAIFAYLLTYEFKIINGAAQGTEEVPMWPEPQGMFESIPLVFGVYIVCFGPSILCMILAFFAGPLGIFLFLFALLLFLMGCFYYPMAYMMNALFMSPLASLNMGFGFKSIGKIFPEYIVVVIFSFLFLVVPIGIGVLLSFAGLMSPEAAVFSSVFGVFVTSFLGLYLKLANGFMLGRLYYATEERLDWFPGTERKLLGPPPQVHGTGARPAPPHQAPAQFPDLKPRRPGTGAFPAPAPLPQGYRPPDPQGAPPQGLDEPPEPVPRRQTSDYGASKWAPVEDPFTKFRDEKIADAPKKEPGWPELFDKAKKSGDKTPPPAAPETPAERQPAPAAQPQQGMLQRKTSFFQQIMPQAPGTANAQQPAPGAAGGQAGNYQTAARARPTGAYPQQPGMQAPQPGPETQPMGSGKRPTGSVPRQGTTARPTGAFKQTGLQNAQQQSSPPPAPAAAPSLDDHMGPIKFSPEVQELIDGGKFDEARRIVTQRRDGAKNRGNLAEMSFYRKQLDIIDVMEKV